MTKADIIEEVYDKLRTHGAYSKRDAAELVEGVFDTMKSARIGPEEVREKFGVPPELVGEVLRVIKQLAEEGRTMLLVTHELGFAYHFATKVIFLADGVFHEVGTPDEVLKNPRKPRTRDFLRRFGEFAF